MKPLVFLQDVARMAVGDLVARPLRSILTVASFSSGIAIASVLIAAGDGLQATVTEILQSLGDGQIVVTPGQTTGMGGQRRAGRRIRIRYADVSRLKEAVPAVDDIAPYFYLRGGGASSWRYSIPYSPVQAIGYEFRAVRGMPIVEGRWFTRDEERQGEWVTVLNEGLRNVIFPETAAVGSWVQWRGRRMEVVGVVRDDALFPYLLFVPYRTVSQMADTRYISGLIARPGHGESWDRAVSQLRCALATLYEFDPLDPNAVEIEDNREFTSRVRTAATGLHALVITIAAISLLLGALGVANMMVIAVTERTREIGIRKALGATPNGIFLQILCEGLAITFTGGIIGLVLAAVACSAAGELPISSKYTAAIRFDGTAALVSIGILAVVGILAGTIPARRAATLQAAEALRWE